MSTNNHVIVLREYGFPQEVDLKTEELHILQKKFSNKISIVNSYDGKIELKAEQYVGYIALPTRIIEIKPKVNDADFINMVKYALGLPEIMVQTFDSSRTENCYDILVRFLLFGTDLLIKRGLHSSYEDYQDNLSMVRGKILFKQHLQTNYGRNDRVFCHFSELTINILENQILKFTISYLLHGNFNREIHALLWSAHKRLEGIEPGQITTDSFKLVQYTPLNEHYRPLLELCKLLLEESALEGSKGGTTSFSYLIDMEKLFQDFVREYIQKRMPAYKVEKDSDYLAERNKIPIYPDIVISKNGHSLLILDTKYKLKSGRPDISQVLSYCLAYDVLRGVLIYPEINEKQECLDHKIRNTDKTIMVRSISLDSEEDKFPGLDYLIDKMETLLQ